MIKKISVVSLLAVLACISGCTVGPDYTAPGLPQKEFTEIRHNTEVEFAQNADPNTYALWWEGLNDPLLTELIKASLESNYDMKAAVARVQQARAALGISEADIWPTLDAAGSFSRTRYSQDVRGGGEQNIHTLGLDASWELDIFGGTRRANEAARADLDAQQANLTDVWISLAAEVAINYTDLRVAQKNLNVAYDNLKAQTDTLDLLISRRKAGLNTQLAVEQARYNVETTRSTIPSIRRSIEAYANNIALLTGVLPGTLHEKLMTDKAIPQPAENLLISIPAEALRNRPDICRAERQLAAQTARVGQATADLYPKFRLNGSIGVEALRADRMFSNGNDYYAAGPSANWNIFDAGRIRNSIKIQDALQEQYLAQYEKTVLTAVKEVRDNLVAWNQEQLRLESLTAAEAAAKDALYFANDQYAAGLSDFNNVLDAQRALLTLQVSKVISEGQIVVDLIRLYKSLGGGWERPR